MKIKMKKWTMIFVTALSVIIPANAIYALQARVDRNLNLVIPCLELGDQQYEIHLDYLDPSSEPPDFAWTFKSLLFQDASESPASIDEQLGISIPNFSIFGIDSNTFQQNWALDLTIDHSASAPLNWTLNNDLFFEVAQSLKNMSTNALVSEQTVTEVREEANGTAFKLYRGISEQSEAEADFVFSPYGMVQSMAMIYAGAANETAAQIKNALQYTLDGDELHGSFHALNIEFASRGQGERGTAVVDNFPILTWGFKLDVVNSIWAIHNPLTPSMGKHDFFASYIDTLGAYYGEGIRFLPLDLMNASAAKEKLADSVNLFIDRATNGQIEQMISSDDLPDDTSLILANAINFNAAWDLPFSVANSDYATFYDLNGDNGSVRMMFQGNEFAHMQGDTFDAAEIPFAGKELSMVVFLPHNGHFAEFEAEFDQNVMTSALDAMTVKIINLHMPRWTTQSNSHMTDLLKSFGITDLFSPDTADLSLIDAKHDLYLGSILHSATIEVKESGVKASSATEAESVGALEVPEFNMDHPFIYVIRDVPTDTILFMGRVVNPE